MGQGKDGVCTNAYVIAGANTTDHYSPESQNVLNDW